MDQVRECCSLGELIVNVQTDVRVLEGSRFPPRTKCCPALGSWGSGVCPAWPLPVISLRGSRKPKQLRGQGALGSWNLPSRGIFGFAEEL